MTQKAYKSGSEFPPQTKGLVRIYSSRICPYAARTRLVLYHKNIKHETINIDLRDKPEWFLAIAPLGKVPVIQRDDLVLYESTAVSEYLDEAFPGDKLQSDEPLRKAWDRILLECYGQVTSAFYKIALNIGQEDKKEELEAGVKLMRHNYKFYEEHLGKRGTKFFHGDKPGMIDFYLWPHLERIPTLVMMCPETELTKTDFPLMADWWEAMTTVPAVKKEMHDANWHFQIYKLRSEGKPYQDLGLEE